MSSAVVIPTALLNMRAHAIIDIALGVIVFVFQIASLAIAPKVVLEQIGIGFWGGLILAITAVAAYKASTGDAPFMLGCTFVLSIFSFLVSFCIMCIFSASVDQMNRYPIPCGTFEVPPNTINFTVPPCGEPSSAREGLDAILIICGLVGIPVNILLIMATITAYSPSATPAA